MEMALPRQSADIIAFPSRRPRLPPEEQLAAALARLQAAVVSQRAAVEQWRESIGALRIAVSQLGRSVQDMHASFGTLGAQTAALHEKAERLECWAGDAAAT